jgi:hypothetical protein
MGGRLLHYAKVEAAPPNTSGESQAAMQPFGDTQ